MSESSATRSILLLFSISLKVYVSQCHKHSSDKRKRNFQTNESQCCLTEKTLNPTCTIHVLNFIVSTFNCLEQNEYWFSFNMWNLQLEQKMGFSKLRLSKDIHHKISPNSNIQPLTKLLFVFARPLCSEVIGNVSQKFYNFWVLFWLQQSFSQTSFKFRPMVHRPLTLAS